MSEYYCTQCGTVTNRESTKRWIKSYCSTAGRMTRLWRKVWPLPEPVREK